MKVYEGKRLNPEENTASDVVVTVDGEPLEHILRHSPDGFSWGYGGSDPADLALSILTDYFWGSVELAEPYYQGFKWEYVSKWGAEWKITDSEVAVFIIEQNRQPV